jgi:DNA modification methylase
MESNPITISFDYEVLSAKQRTILQQRTQEIKQILRRSAQDIWEIGHKLVEVRAQLKKEGQFEGWLQAEFSWSRRTAYNFINVYETFPNSTDFARLDIAPSALYKLGAPSTPPDLREEFINKAKQGEKIAHKDVERALKSTQNSSVSAAPANEQLATASRPAQILALIPKNREALPLPSAAGQTSKPDSDYSRASQTQIEIEPDCWYLLAKKQFLFCGDTALESFHHRVSAARLALAITADDWDHDWLIEKASNVILLKPSFLKEGLIEQTILLYSQPGESVIFPWLPEEELLAIAHRLNRQIIAGDRDPELCRRAIARAGLTVERLNLARSQ